jgi:hypothetical protein
VIRRPTRRINSGQDHGFRDVALHKPVHGSTRAKEVVCVHGGESWVCFEAKGEQEWRWRKIERRPLSIVERVRERREISTQNRMPLPARRKRSGDDRLTTFARRGTRREPRLQKWNIRAFSGTWCRESPNSFRYTNTGPATWPVAAPIAAHP